MSHRLFAQLAFERALQRRNQSTEGRPCREGQLRRSDQLAQADFSSQYDVEALASELDQIIDDRTRDVLDGPGVQVIERGELFFEPEIVALVNAAKSKRDDPG